MIKKINKIKKFGIIINFKWDSMIPEFREYNLIYGWNYTGKTTISRIFQSFEHKQIHNNFVGAEFELTNDQGIKYSNNDLTTLPYIRVFNTEFIKRNLKWHIESEQIEPIFILGEENIKDQEQLDDLRKVLDSLTNNFDEIKNKIANEETNLESAFTDRARVIKDLLQWPDYDKRQLKQTLSIIKQDHQNHLLPENEYRVQMNTYQNTIKKENLYISNLPAINYQNISNKIKEIAGRRIIAEVIQKLKDNPRLNIWVKEGIELHEGEIVCQFCGNKLSPDLIDRLEKHFSQDFDQLQSDITFLENDIKIHKASFEKYMGDFPDKARLYEEFHSEYEQLNNEIKKEITLYTKALDKMESLLQDKKQNPFNTITFSEKQIDKQIITGIKNKIDIIVKKHNKKTEDFDKLRIQARKKLEKHHTSDFIDKFRYFDFINNLETLKKKKQNTFDEITKTNSKIQELEQQVSETINGAERINEILKFFFRDKRLKIKTNDNNYQIYRNGEIAKNLSEGEKTAISFAYFLIRLEDKNTDLQNSIIFIDDPVCSLDSNHIHNVYSFIKSKFGNKCCKQLFVSTHNLEFLNLIKDFIIDELNINNENKSENAPFYYMEKRLNATSNHATLIKLPIQLKRFKSEYSYLFSLLFEFKNNPTDDFKMLFLLPNITRRFLEAYLGFRKPDSKSWSKKLDILFSEVNDLNLVVKFVHEYSHNTTSERLLKFPDLSECKQVVTLVLEALEKKDQIHYEALSSNCI